MTIRVARDQRMRVRHDIYIGECRLTTDLSVENGGDGSGPTPHDFYDSALGACKALTMLLYAKRRDIPLEDIEVSVDRDASREREGIYRISTVLKFSGALSSAQRDELLRVAKKCPIQKLMTEAPRRFQRFWPESRIFRRRVSAAARRVRFV
jgi:putative redox protein